MKILFLDPVGHDDMLLPIGQFLTPFKGRGTELHLACLGPEHRQEHLEFSAYEALVAGDIVRATRQAADEGFDAMIIGCFYDIALHAAREVAGHMTVVGPCQASLSIAAQIAERYSIIIGREKWRLIMDRLVHEYGQTNRVLSWPALEMSPHHLRESESLTSDRLGELSRRAVRQGAEALVLGCSLNFGFHTQLQQALGIPVIDPILASFYQAEHLVHVKRQQNWSVAGIGLNEGPTATELREYNLLQEPYTFGKRIRMD